MNDEAVACELITGEFASDGSSSSHPYSVMAQLELEVVTPERRVLSESVDMVTVPGLGGELGILARATLR